MVEEGNLAVQVSSLRKVLGSEAIATVPGRGYRFTAPVTERVRPSAPAVQELADRPPTVGTEMQAASPTGQHAAYAELMLKLRRTQGAADMPGALDEGLMGHVPAAMTALVGRASALNETRQLLQSTRCLTLTGAGGAGKTRLALALAEGSRSLYPDGVWWIELDKLSDPASLVPAIAHSLGTSDPHKPDLQALALRLKGRKVLLVLDNCEHLIERCAEVAVQLLRELPSLQVLATSREALRIAGEVAWSVPPLQVPADTATQGWNELLQQASVQLLVQRIRQHDPRFVLHPELAPSLVKICRGLDGMPLALELVAAQVGPRSLAHIAARLDQSLNLLTVGARGGMRHHQTMAAAVDWGFKLLGDAERAVFSRLSVFTGGWTPDGAEAVCQGLTIESEDVPAVLGRLHRVSMVLASPNEGRLRFRMLEPIRQFALTKLDELGQVDLIKRQLLAWYVGRCKLVAIQLAGPQQLVGYEFLSTEFDNLRSLLSWSKQADLENGLRLAADLWRFWQVKGHAKELLAWFEDALAEAAKVPLAVRADACNAAGVMARTCGAYDKAVRLHTAGLDLQRELGNRRGEAIALNNLCVVARDQHEHAAVERQGRAALQLAREIGERNLEGLALMHLGTALRGLDRPEDAEDSFKLSLEIFSELGEHTALAAVHNFLGSLAQAAGRLVEAAQRFEQSLALNRELGNHWGLGISTCNQASLSFESADLVGAHAKLMHSLAHYRRAGARHGLEECFELLARIEHELGHIERAAWCWGVVERLELDIGKQVPLALNEARQQTLRSMQAQMPEPLVRAARDRGRHTSLDEALQRVLTEHPPG